jgi:hypothetical protein
VKIGAETILQIQICEWIKQNTDLPFYHFVNEGKRSNQMGMMLKRMGMTAGVSDLFLPRGNKEWKGMWIELKIKPNKPTKLQENFMLKMAAEGYHCTWHDDFDHCISCIRQFYSIK